jgi:chitodextrinase
MSHSVQLFNLTPETDYHFEVKSVDAFGQTTFSADKVFSTPAEAVINSIKISNIDYTSAIIAWNTGLFTSSTIEYGTTLNYGQSEVSDSRSFLTNHVVQLTNLTQGTNYHFRIIATDENGNVSSSNDELFSTFALPIFTSVNVVPGINDVTMNWKTNVFTTGIITYKSANDPAELSAGDITPTDTHSVLIKNLLGKTTYTYNIEATDAHGKKVDTGPRTFTTLTRTTPPVISALKVAITNSGGDLVLTVTWNTDEAATSKVTYAEKNNLGNVTDLPASSNLVTQHLIVSTGLVPSEPYTLKVISSDNFNNTAQETINFVTPGVTKSIFQLILDNIFQSFGPIIKLFGS